MTRRLAILLVLVGTSLSPPARAVAPPDTLARTRGDVPMLSRPEVWSELPTYRHEGVSRTKLAITLAGVSLYDAQGCTIRDNVCMSRWPDGPRPWIMLGQKKKQAHGNTVRDNLAHSFNFKADAEVKAENNREVTEAEFRRKLAALAASIDAKFGKLHPAGEAAKASADRSSGPRFWRARRANSATQSFLESLNPA